MLESFSSVVHDGLRLEGGGYRRDHLRAFAQRVEVADSEVRIMGSKSELLRTLVAASSGKSATLGVHSSLLKWRAIPQIDQLILDCTVVRLDAGWAA